MIGTRGAEPEVSSTPKGRLLAGVPTTQKNRGGRVALGATTVFNRYHLPLPYHVTFPVQMVPGAWAQAFNRPLRGDRVGILSGVPPKYAAELLSPSPALSPQLVCFIP